MEYQIRIEGGVRISGKHEFVIDTYYRRVEIDGMTLYYLNSDEAVETLNELLNREITPEEMNYLRGVSLLDYRRHRKWLERFRDRPIGELKRAVLLSYILCSYWREEEKKKQWLIENGYSEGELRARKIAHELLGDNDRHLLRLRLPREEAEERQNRAEIPLRCPPDGCGLPGQEVRNRRLLRGFQRRRGMPSIDSAQVLSQGLR
jgi:hypothetical protein